MKKNQKDKILETANFDELLQVKYGDIGTKKRDEFESKTQCFVISEMLKESSIKAKMIQEQLADKVGTKKSYI